MMNINEINEKLIKVEDAIMTADAETSPKLVAEAYELYAQKVAITTHRLPRNYNPLNSAFDRIVTESYIAMYP
jgi:hypothetical protein